MCHVNPSRAEGTHSPQLQAEFTPLPPPPHSLRCSHACCIFLIKVTKTERRSTKTEQNGTEHKGTRSRTRSRSRARTRAEQSKPYHGIPYHGIACHMRHGMAYHITCHMYTKVKEADKRWKQELRKGGKPQLQLLQFYNIRKRIYMHASHCNSHRGS